MSRKHLRLSALLLASVMILALLAGCGQPAASQTPPPPAPPSSAPETATPPPAPEKKVLKVGFITTLTGSKAANGIDMRNGFQMYLDEHDYTLAGYTIQAIIEDDEAGVEMALQKARKLVEKDEVDLIYGIMSANTGYAVAEYCVQNEVPLILPTVAGEDLTQRQHSPYVIRTGWTAAQPMHPFGEWAYEQGFRRVACLSFDYAFGHESVSGFQRTFEEAGGTIVTKVWSPQGTQDYVPYLTQLPKDIDALFIHFSGSDCIRALQQIRETGIDVPILGGSTTTDEHVLVSMGDEAVGVYSALMWCADLDRPATQEFVAAYKERFGKTPSYYSMECYTGLAFLEAGLAGSSIDNLEAFTAALKAATVECPHSDMTLDDYNNPIQDIYIRQVQRVDGELVNVHVKTYPQVSQFWTYDPAEYLKEPVYSRDYPPLKSGS